MIKDHLGNVLSFHLQKKSGGLVQKWPSYDDFCAATWILLKICRSARLAIRLKFWIGTHDPNFWAIAPIFFCVGLIYITTFGGNHLWGPSTEGADSATPSVLGLWGQKGPKSCDVYEANKKNRVDCPKIGAVSPNSKFQPNGWSGRKAYFQEIQVAARKSP